MREVSVIPPGGDHKVTAVPAARGRTDAPGRAATRLLSRPDDAPAWLVSPPEDFPMPADAYVPEDPDDPEGPRLISEQDQWDAELDAVLGRSRFSRVDAVEWELWDGVDQDEAERELLRLEAPAWVFLPPGGQLATELEGTRPQAMSPMALIELMKAASKLSGWAESIKAAAMASFYRQRQAEHRESPRPTQLDSKGRPIDPERSWYGEMALALGLSPNTIGRRVDTALRLTSTLSATHTALRCGALTWGKALAISEATRDLPGDAAQAVEAHVLKRAGSQTHKNLLESLRRQVAKHTTREAATRHRAAVTDRTCKIVPLAEGMAGLWIVHTADKIQQMWVAIQAIAKLAKRQGVTLERIGPHPRHGTPARPYHPAATPQPRPPPQPRLLPQRDRRPATPATAAATRSVLDTADTRPPSDAPTDAQSAARVKDDRTAEQRRADVTADLFEHILRNGLDWLGRRLPDQHRRRPHIEVVVPASTLLGLDDDPAELTGYGPIPAEMARRIARDGTWRRLLTDPRERRRPGSVHHPPRPRRPGERDLARPVPGLRLARLQPDLPGLRPRPHHPVRPNRDHQPDRPGAVLRIPPRHQRHSRVGLGHHQSSRRLHHVDHPHRPSLHDRSIRPRSDHPTPRGEPRSPKP